MKITDKRILLAFILLASILWQPSHHILMHHGISMNFATHALITIIPFLSFVLVFGRATWSQ